MFVTKEQVQALTGYEVSQHSIALAQLMIETFVGRNESQVTDADDLATLARATALQAAYVGDDQTLLLEQAAVKSISANEATTVFNLDLFSPYYSPFAVLACRRLSWMGSRSVNTGPTFSVPGMVQRWEVD